MSLGVADVPCGQDPPRRSGRLGDGGRSSSHLLARRGQLQGQPCCLPGAHHAGRWPARAPRSRVHVSTADRPGVHDRRPVRVEGCAAALHRVLPLRRSEARRRGIRRPVSDLAVGRDLHQLAVEGEAGCDRALALDPDVLAQRHARPALGQAAAEGRPAPGRRPPSRRRSRARRRRSRPAASGRPARTRPGGRRRPGTSRGRRSRRPCRTGPAPARSARTGCGCRRRGPRSRRCWRRSARARRPRPAGHRRPPRRVR